MQAEAEKKASSNSMMATMQEKMLQDLKEKLTALQKENADKDK